jgi:protein SCO1/2
VIVALTMVVMLGVAACGGTSGRGSDGGERLIGTDLGQHPSPGFALTDHRGQAVSLTDLRGRAVALTFVYTSCPDVCPLIASALRAGYEQLDPAVQERVALVAITVDPERDTPAALRAFSAAHRLDDNPNWYALTGERAALATVWEGYGIEPDAARHLTEHGQGHAAPAASGGDGMLAHTDAIYFIDPDGRERVLLRGAATPAEIAQNLRVLSTTPASE